MKPTPLVTFAIVCLLAACTRPEEPRVDLVLAGGDVVDVASGEILRERDVWIVDGRIDAVVPSGERRIPKTAATVDVRGRFLLPGLVDAHVHLDHPDELELYLTQGVTTVFNLRGLPRHLAWRDEIARGERDGPAIYTTGDYMDGYPPFMQPMMSFDSPEDAAASVRAQKAAGYDMVKVYTRLSIEQLRAIAAAASEVGMPVVGHGSANYTLREMVEAGQINAAHGQDLLRWYTEADEPDSVGPIVETLRGSGVTVTTSLAFTAGLIRQAADLDGLLAEPIAKALPPAVLQPFRRANNRYVRRGVDWLPEIEARIEVEKRLLRELHEAGVTLLAGTDASTSGVLPGSSLHLELELLVDAGLSPLDALRTATLAPGHFVAEHVDENERFGRITEGYRADLLVLPSDPLEDVSRVRDALGVVARGRWHAREDLDARLEALAAKSRALTPRVIEIEDAIKSGDLPAARRLFDAARAESPGEFLFSQYVPFFIGYGYLYGEDGYHPDPVRREAALELYRMYAETYPTFHSAHYMLALAQQANGDDLAAARSLERALEIHPYYPDARRELAKLETGDARPAD